LENGTIISLRPLDRSVKAGPNLAPIDPAASLRTDRSSSTNGKLASIPEQNEQIIGNNPQQIKALKLRGIESDSMTRLYHGIGNVPLPLEDEVHGD